MFLQGSPLSNQETKTLAPSVRGKCILIGVFSPLPAKISQGEIPGAVTGLKGDLLGWEGLTCSLRTIFCLAFKISLKWHLPKSHAVLCSPDVKHRAQLYLLALSPLALPVWSLFMLCYLHFPQRVASLPGYPSSVVSPNTEAQKLSHCQSCGLFPGTSTPSRCPSCFCPLATLFIWDVFNLSRATQAQLSETSCSSEPTQDLCLCQWSPK
jgi:hypothetical protein